MLQNYAIFMTSRLWPGQQVGQGVDSGRGIAIGSYRKRGIFKQAQVVGFAGRHQDHRHGRLVSFQQTFNQAGLHREAVFWIAATYCRCRIIFQNDAPDALVRYDPGFQALLEDLGIASYADRERRCEQTREFMPRVWSVAEAIIAANREITD